MNLGMSMGWLAVGALYFVVAELWLVVSDRRDARRGSQ